MNCTDKLAQKLGFSCKADLVQYFELFPEAHKTIKEIYKKEYEQFYTNYTKQSIEIVQQTLAQKTWTPEKFSRRNKEMTKGQALNWDIIMNPPNYTRAVPSEKMDVLETRINKIDINYCMDTDF